MYSDTRHPTPDTLRGPTLVIDLCAIAANYALLKKHFTGGECASVVKADAYGLGVAGIAPALTKAGCKTFFVATLEEGIELRGVLPEARIAVFHGPYENEEREYLHHRLIPVLNHAGQITRWAAANSGKAESFLHADTGMNRLGLNHNDAIKLAGQPELLTAARITTLMSHLACAGEPEHPLNAEQLARFTPIRHLFPQCAASLCNSAGIFLGQRFHHDLARPGCALYGIHSTPGERMLSPVVTLSAPILQLRTVERADTVGYGATCRLSPGQRIATVQLGYADGFLRALSNQGNAHIGGQSAPLLGRVSMDMVIVDVSRIPENALAPGTPVEFINATRTVDDVATAAGTIGYEVFTRIGRRIARIYKA